MNLNGVHVSSRLRIAINLIDVGLFSMNLKDVTGGWSPWIWMTLYCYFHYVISSVDSISHLVEHRIIFSLLFVHKILMTWVNFTSYLLFSYFRYNVKFFSTSIPCFICAHIDKHVRVLLWLQNREMVLNELVTVTHKSIQVTNIILTLDFIVDHS